MSVITRFVKAPGVIIVRKDSSDMALLIRTKPGPKEKAPATGKPYRCLPLDGDETFRLQIAKMAIGSYKEVVADVIAAVQAYVDRNKAKPAAKKVAVKKAQSKK